MNLHATFLNKILAHWIQQYIMELYSMTKGDLWQEYKDGSTSINQSMWYIKEWRIEIIFQKKLNIFDKNLSWKDRNLNKVGIEDILNVIKATYDKPTANIFNCEKLTFL